VQQIGEVLRPALASHEAVVADRFLYTAEVLARFGRKLERQWIDPALQTAHGGITPDLVVLVDIDPFFLRARNK
jgi:dTMP kinase